MTRFHRRRRGLAVAVLTAVALTACGSGATGGEEAETPRPAPDALPAEAADPDDPRPDPTDATITVTPYVASYFLESVVQEHHAGDRRVVKWQTDVRVGVEGTASQRDLEVVDETIAAFAPYLDPLTVRRAGSPNVVVHIAPKYRWAELVDDPEVGLDAAGWTYTYSRAGEPDDPDAGLTRAVIVVDADAPQVARDRTIAHELGHAFGLGHGGCPATLMFHGRDSSPLWAATPLDVEMVRLLYHPAILHGMSTDEVRDVLDASGADGPACDPVRWQVVVYEDTDYLCGTGDGSRPCVRYDGRLPTWPVESPDAWAKDGYLLEYDPDRWERYRSDQGTLLCERTVESYAPCVVFDGTPPPYPVTDPQFWTDGSFVYDADPR